MSRRKPIPSYRRHRPSGQAVVTLSSPTGERRDYYLGPYRSDASKAEYNRLIAEWLASGKCIPHTGPAPADVTVNELLLRFWSHVQAYYRHPDGSPTAEVDNYGLSLRPLRKLYGHTVARDFGPLALKAVRQSMIDSGLSRRLINQRVGRIRRCFKWGVAEQLVPASVYHALAAVEGLGKGRSAAVEVPPVEPVPDELVEQTLAKMSRHVAGMVRFQRLTGCRPGEVCRLRRCDIDTNGDVWVYRPAAHKTAHRDKDRAVAIGPRAQDVLSEFPTADASECVFSPIRAREERFKAVRAARVTAVQPSQVCRAKHRPKRRPGPRYTTRSYAQAIAKACERAGIDRWSPNQLRHAAATAIREVFGLEAAQVVLGHVKADVTQVYAERNYQLAARVALQTG
jgi:integrase